MFPLSTRFILLVSSLAAAYFAVWFGAYSGELTTWSWSMSTKENVWGLVAIVLGVVITLSLIAGIFCSVLSVGIALDIACSEKSEREIQELYVVAAFACLLLCFVYGAMATPGAIPWFLDKWNLLLVFALMPSVFALKQVLFDILFQKRAAPAQADVIPINRRSG